MNFYVFERNEVAMTEQRERKQVFVHLPYFVYLLTTLPSTISFAEGSS